ncbi:MAG: helix-turn-helix domain-containing protein [Pseudonocardiaceae bacterium]
MSHSDERPINPALYERADLRAALAAHELGPVFDAVNSEAGLSYREIGRRTGSHESVIDAIRKGRVVERYDVLVRIAEGLGIPREFMGLSYGTRAPYAEGVPVADTPEGVDADMRRRYLLAAAGVAIVGEPIKNLGELLGELPDPSRVPAPSRVDGVHVAKVRDLTRRLGEAGRAYGSDPEVSSAAAAWATRLLDVPGAEPVKQELKAAVGALHIHAGWAAFDAALADRTMYHYTRGLELATEAGDAYLQAVALAWAGLATEEHGHPNDGLKMLQFAQVKAWNIPPGHERVKGVEAWALADSATAYARLGDPTAAHAQLAKSRDLWSPKRTDTMGDLDIVAARIEVGRGRLDAAEPLAAASVRRWQGTSERARSQAGVVLATIHVRAGEPGGLGLAHTAISAVSRLSSVRARKRLGPLAEALDARPGTDYQNLARMARQVATTRA